MDKIAKINELVERLKKVTCCNAYIIGVAIDGKVYACICNELVDGLHLSTASKKNGGCITVKFQPNKADKKAIIEKSTEYFYLCDEQYIENEYETSKYTRGHIFEKLVTEYYGMVWEVDHNRIDKAPDLEINNVKYSIKYQRAEYISERTLINIETGK